MTEEHILTLPRTDQTRADFALNDARLPARGDLAKAALGGIISTAALVIIWADAFWRL